METKRENADLPVEILALIDTHLTTNQSYKWSMTHKGLCTLFRTHPDFFHSRFLTCVARGEEDEARKFLKLNLTFMTQEGWVIDYSNRQFHTSAFKYILGALDTRYMFTMFLKCLSEDKQLPLQRKINIAFELLKQNQEFEKEGISYILDGEIHQNEQHFGFTPLIDALKTYVNNSHKGTWREREKCFCTGVGKAQILVPAHLAQHYCDPDFKFSPTPLFTAETFTRRLDVINCLTNTVYKWWEQESTLILGQDCGFIRSSGGYAMQSGGGFGMTGWGSEDLEAVTALFEARMRDRLSIKDRLLTLIQELKEELESEEQHSLQL